MIAQSTTSDSDSAARADAAARTRARWTWLAVAALLAAYATMSFTAALRKGLSFDEGEQLAVGYNLWLRNDYRIEGANGDLVKRWATLPYLVSRPKFPGTDDPYWQKAEPYLLGFRFFFEMGNRPESLLRQGRAMMALLGVALGLLIFVCSREIFGPVGGLISLGAFAFSPHMLAFGGIVSTDLSITLTLFGSTWCIWRLLHVITWGRVLGSLGMFGLLLLAKATALVIFPITAVLLAVKFAAGGPLLVRWRGRERIIASRRGQAVVFSALVLLHAVIGWSSIWAHYGFRYRASPDPTNPAVILRPQYFRDGMAPPVARFISWSHSSRFFPEGYRIGISRLLGSDDSLRSFMAGEWRAGGRWSFFPYAIWVKTRPALMLLLVLGIGFWWWTRRREAAAPGGNGPTTLAPSLYAVTPHLALIGIYLTVAIMEDINLGHRHVLPIYPALDVLAGAVALLWVARAWWLKAIIGVLLAWMVTDSWAVRPNYLSYFGAQAGGPPKGYTHLVDSSLDWGMNLPGLKRWLDEHNPDGREPVFLAYFGTDSPDYYGIKARRLPGFPNWGAVDTAALTPGYYVISASLLQGVYTAAFGPWSKEYERAYQSIQAELETLNHTVPNSPERLALIQKMPPGYWDERVMHFQHLRLARLCAWLRQQGEPPNHVGHAIFIWKLDYAALRAALVGPPVELTDAPPRYLPL